MRHGRNPWTQRRADLDRWQENQRNGAWANQIGERELRAGRRATHNDPAASSIARESTAKNGRSVNRCKALTNLRPSGFPPFFQHFIHRKFCSERIFLLRRGGLIPMLILRNEGSSDPEGRAQQRVLGSGGAPATKGPRIWRSVRDKGSSDLAERPRRRVRGLGGVFATKGLRIRRSVHDEGSSDLEECSRQRVFGSGGASATKGSESRSCVDRKAFGLNGSGGVRSALRSTCRDFASKHLMPPFNFACLSFRFP